MMEDLGKIFRRLALCVSVHQLLFEGNVELVQKTVEKTESMEDPEVLSLKRDYSRLNTAVNA